MKIKLSYVSYLKINEVSNNSLIGIEAGTSIEQFIKMLDIKGDTRRFIIPTVNGQRRKLDYILQENDDLFLFVPVEGG